MERQRKPIRFKVETKSKKKRQNNKTMKMCTFVAVDIPHLHNAPTRNVWNVHNVTQYQTAEHNTLNQQIKSQ